MRLAKALRKKGYTGKLIHYVCPSVWAWRKARIKDLTQTLDLLLTILPFEKNCFSHTQLPVTYIGHPLVAAIDHHAYDPDWNPEGKKYLSIFPGSRPSEIALNLPLQLQAAKPFADELPLAISVAHPDLEQPIREILAKTVLKATLVPNHHRYELMRDSHVALATSGTVNLELGLHAIPSVVTYQIGTFNYLLGRYVFRIILPYYSIVNIICDQELYPEFIHRTLDHKKISAALQKRIEDREHYYQQCLKLRSHLQTHDASQEAAKAISQIL